MICDLSEDLIIDFLYKKGILKHLKTNIQDIKSDAKPIEQIKSHIAGLDIVCGGFTIGEVTVIAAGSGVGKSMCALNSALRIAESGEQVLYLSLENGINVDASRIDYLSHQYNTDFYYLSDCSMNTHNLEYLVAYLKPKIVFIDSLDYITTLDGEHSADAMESYNYFGELMSQLRAIAQLYNCAVVTTVQLARGALNMDIQSVTSDIVSGSKKIDRIAYTEMIIHRNPKDSRIYGTITKHRGNCNSSRGLYWEMDNNFYLNISVAKFKK